MKPRLQNKIAGSHFTLPVCVAIAATLWWLPECNPSWQGLLGLLFCLLTAYVLMETNTRHLIIRIRTRLVSATWLVLAACLPFMHPLGAPIIAATLLSISYLLLFSCYQQHHPQQLVFHVFLMLGAGSFFAPIMLPMAALYYFYLAVLLRSLTWKAFWAGIVGLITPCWCYAVWSFLTNSMPDFIAHLSAMAQIQLPSIGQVKALPFAWQLSAGIVALSCIVSILHFLRTNYDDKIRVRMYLYIYITQTLVLLAFLPLQPAHYPTTMALILVSACPLIAHYFALTGSRLSNLFFLLSLLLTAGMAVLNLWMTSFSIS